MNLEKEIEILRKSMVEMIPEDSMKVLTSATEALIKSGIADKSIKTGDKAVDFCLPDANGKLVSLKEALNSGAVVISFYRGAWCPYCNLELKALQNILPEIKKLGATLIAISPNLPDKSLTSIEKHNLKFPVLSDIGNKVARSYGLVFQLEDEIRPIYESFGIDVAGHNGDDSWELPLPATYVINQAGVVVHSFVDADYVKRMEPKELLEALEKCRG